MPHWLKITSRILLLITGLLLTLWIVLVCYVNYNKKSFLKAVIAQLNDRINGDIIMSNVDLEVFRSFPNMSVSLRNVALRDSLWGRHKHDLLRCEYLYANLGITTIIKGKPVISELIAKNGSIYLYSDSSGYSNTSVFQNNINKKPRQGSPPEFKSVALENILFTINNEQKFKYFVIQVNRMTGNWNYSPGAWDADFETDAFIRNFCFNVTRGSFLQNKTLKGTIQLHFDKVTRRMTVPEQTLYVHGNPVQFKGWFDFKPTPPLFQLAISAKQIMLRDASALLTKPIYSKVNLVNLDRPLDVNALLIGRMKFRDTPWVRVYWAVKDNVLSTPVGRIDKSNFTGYFTNQVVRGATYGDPNSAIHVYNMKGVWYGIPYFADSASVTDLKNPVLETRLRSLFELKKINPITKGNTFDFTAGTLKLDLLLKLALSDADTSVPYIYGTAKMEKAGITYNPRNLSFKNTSGILRFTGSDLSFADIHMESSSSVLNMDGNIKDFLTLFYRSPEKAVINWHVRSPNVDAADFLVFTSKPKYADVGSDEHPKVRKMMKRLNTLLDKGSAHLEVNISKLTYHKFDANTVQADIVLRDPDVILNNIRLNHAHGVLQLKGKVQPGKTTNFNLDANISHVNVQELFSGFDNFRQDAITADNLRGSLTAESHVNGAMQNGKIIPWSLNGDVSFHLTDGAIVNFDAFKRMGKIIFRRRDLSNITLRKLENTLQVQGKKIIINPMVIESSVANIYLKGIYAFDTGTHIDIELPLHNPKKDDVLLTDEQRKDQGHKGIKIYLQATDGSDGKVKIKWVPFKGQRIDPDTSTVQMN